MNKQLQCLGVMTSLTKENGFLYMQACWLYSLYNEKNKTLVRVSDDYFYSRYPRTISAGDVIEFGFP